MERRQQLIQKIESVFDVDAKHVGVLDGVRALAVLCVLWFHFWQQTWLMPVYDTPFLKWMGVEKINPDVIRRVGYLCVDMMLLLSGFLLYLPYARSRFYGTSVDGIRVFYKKRFARIVPSYLLAVLIMFAIAWTQGAYKGKPDFAVKDLLTHLTFTQMLWADTFLFTLITAVMWTVCIEVAFYLIFPFLAKGFHKNPLLVYALMTLIGVWFTNSIAPAIGETRIMVNRFLTFLPVFANGMMAAHLYVWYARKVKYKAIPSLIGTAAAVFSLIWIVRLFTACMKTGDAAHQQVWQRQYRTLLSLAYSVLILGCAISAKPLRKILDNRILKSIAAVSYNIYLWHQWLMVRLCTMHGAKSGRDIANGSKYLQWTVTAVALAETFIIASLISYGFERPMSKLILHTKEESKCITR